MDFNGVLTADEVREVETAVNEVIGKNLPVEITYPSKEELKTLDYRSKIEIEGQVRIVTIPGVDVCACCAPHVKKTGEIGMLNVQSLSNYKGGVRISILSGFRALEEERKKSQVISSISGTLSANQELLPELVEKLKQSNQDLKYKLAQAKQKLVEQKMKEIPADQENVLLFETDLDTPVMRNAINGLVETHAGICGIFVEKEEGGYNFIIGSKTKDCRKCCNDPGVCKCRGEGFKRIACVKERYVREKGLEYEGIKSEVRTADRDSSGKRRDCRSKYCGDPGRTGNGVCSRRICRH